MTQATKQDDTRLNLASHDAVGERIEQLKALLPEIFVEGQIDPERLRQHLGDFSKVGTERYGLNWAGKADAIRSLQIPSHGTLVPMKDQSVNFDESENLIIEGDNLEVLKLLQKSYHGKIKMIYIDPPYNTGGDFIYPDNFKEGLDTYLRYSGQATEEGFKVSTNSESGGRYHSNWLNMMYPRLFVAKSLLRDDGVICISIDDHELHNLVTVLNEIFGEESHVATLSIINNLKGRNDKANVATCHEHLVIFARPQFMANGLPLNEEQLKEYKYTDGKKERYALRDLRKRGRPDRREDRPNMYFPIYYNQHKKTFSLARTSPNDIEITPKRGDGSDGRWRWGRDRVSANLDILEAKYSEKKERWDIEHRVYLNPNFRADAAPADEEADDDDVLFERTSKSKSFWWGGEISSDVGRREFKKLFEDMDFDYPKSPFFLERIIRMCSNNGDIVMDFFAGSGTTGQAVLNLNREDKTYRKFILVQLPQPLDENSEAYKKGYRKISDVCFQRVKRTIEQIGAELSSQFKLEETPYGLNFKAFQLTSSNFKLWDASAGSKDADGLAKQLELYADNLLPGRSQDDILYEVILKTGQPLTAKIEIIEVAGQKVFSIDGGAMLICLEDPIKEETLVGMLEYQPAIMVALDKAFHGNDQLKTNIKLQAESTGESEQSRVLFKTV